MNPEELEDIVDRVIFQTHGRSTYLIPDVINHVVRYRTLSHEEKEQVEKEYLSLTVRGRSSDRYLARYKTAKAKFSSLGRTQENPSRRDWP